VETLLLLGEVPLLAGLSTRQLAELAEAVRWEELRPGDVAVAAGERLDALVVVAHGALVMGEGAAARRLGPGAAVDELAVVAPRPTPAAAVAAEPTRLARLARIDFEQLVDEVPGLASAVCRALGERARGG
jgi:CRP-like cAMP-binding protein